MIKVQQIFGILQQLFYFARSKKSLLLKHPAADNIFYL